MVVVAVAAMGVVAVVATARAKQPTRTRKIK
jgi:hypothetical protein